MELFLVQLAWLARLRELGLAAEPGKPDPRWADIWRVHALLGSPCMPLGHGKVWGYKHERKR